MWEGLSAPTTEPAFIELTKELVSTISTPEGTWYQWYLPTPSLHTNEQNDWQMPVKT